MNKSTLLAVLVIGIIASYGIEVFIQQKVYPALGWDVGNKKTYRIEVSREEYQTLREIREEQKSCDCVVHIYGTSDTRIPCPRGPRAIR